jgi:hypothetical protein
MNQEQLQETKVNEFEKLLTYSEWNAKGFRVHKGSKARGFKGGQALFGVADTYKQHMSSCLGDVGPWDDMPH